MFTQNSIYNEKLHTDEIDHIFNRWSFSNEPIELKLKTGELISFPKGLIKIPDRKYFRDSMNKKIYTEDPFKWTTSGISRVMNLNLFACFILSKSNELYQKTGDVKYLFTLSKLQNFIFIYHSELQRLDKNSDLLKKEIVKNPDSNEIIIPIIFDTYNFAYGLNRRIILEDIDKEIFNQEKYIFLKDSPASILFNFLFKKYNQYNTKELEKETISNYTILGGLIK